MLPTLNYNVFIYIMAFLRLALEQSATNFLRAEDLGKCMTKCMTVLHIEDPWGKVCVVPSLLSDALLAAIVFANAFTIRSRNCDWDDLADGLASPSARSASALKSGTTQFLMRFL